MKVDQLDSLVNKLKKLRAEAEKNSDASVTVGYTQSYAVIVHEVDRNYNGGKQWKYLESPARTLQGEIATIVRTVFTQTRDLLQALLIAGLRLQRASQEIVPVDTSALKASAFTCDTTNEDSVAAEAYARSEVVRLGEEAKRKAARDKAKAKKVAERAKKTK